MQQQVLISFSLVLILHFTNILAQPPAAAPAQPPATPAHKPPPLPAAKPPPLPAAKSPPAPPAQSPAMVPVQTTKGTLDVIKVLQKAGHFTFFIRLIRTTQEDIQLNSQLNNSMDGVTIFAPTDGAFQTIIKSGTLNSLTDQQKIELVQFHVIPRILTVSQFQTISNPLKTLAGSGSRFELDVTATDSYVNVTSGLTNTTVSGVVYLDSKAAIYQVDKVLLPVDLFAAKPPAPVAAPPPKPAKEEGVAAPVVPTKDVSGVEECGVVVSEVVIVGVGVIAALFSFL